MNGHSRWSMLFGCLLALAGRGVSAQWLTQEVRLRAGWNAVYLHVQPLPADCSSQFARTPVVEVHRFNQRVRTALFETDPSKPFRRPSEWLTWRPDDGTNGYVRTLANLTGDTAYLVHATQSFVWKVAGRPVLPHREWVPGIPNLVGFPIDAGSAPTFAEFFGPEPRIPVVGGPADLFVQDIDANLNGIDLTTRTRRQAMAAGHAYWIRAQSPSGFSGPLVVSSSDPQGLIFGGQANELPFRLQNLSSNRTAVTLVHTPSEVPPAGMPARVAEVPLRILEVSATNSGWKPWSLGEARVVTLGPGETRDVRLAVNRAAMRPTGDSNATWQSLVRVTGAGMQVHVPVSAAAEVAGGVAAPYPAGLWVGEASLTHVTYLQAVTNAAGVYVSEVSADAVVRKPFPLRLIVHQASDGTIRLLPRALIALSTNSGQGVIRLFSSEREANLPAAQWTSLSRISSPAFAALGSPLALNNLGTNWSGSYTSTDNDPQNPYRHVYHPQHTNGLPIGNLITFGFDVQPTSGQPGGAARNPEETLSGTFRNQITGLRNSPISVSGPFTLRRVSPIGQLDPAFVP